MNRRQDFICARTSIGRSQRARLRSVALSLVLGSASASIAGAAVPLGECEPHWDNTIGQPGMSNPVFALTVFDDGSGPALYAGGSFITAGGVTVNRIARWNGEQWSALGSGMNDGVSALAVFDDGSGPALYAGGNFTTAGGVEANYIAKWDGQQWSAVGSGMGGGTGLVSALEVFDDGSGPALYAGGFFTIAGGVEANYIAKWDGQQWSAVGGGVDGEAAPLSPSIRDLTVFDDGSGPALYAGGTFTVAGGSEAYRVARWDGQQWSALGDGVSCCLVWTVTGFDDGNGPALYAGGDFLLAGGDLVRRIAKWDGKEWFSLGTGMSAPHPTVPSVRALEVFDDGSGPALYAGGQFTTADEIQVNRIAKWDGMEWSPLSKGIPGGIVHALAAIPQDTIGKAPALFVGGGYSVVDEDLRANRISAWQGCALITELAVPFEIRPGSCPNPLNAIAQGVLPAAILGDEDFDVTLIDSSTIALMRADGVGGSVAPLDGPPGPGINIEDVGTPLDNEDSCACHELGPDGIDDLALKFNIPQLVAAFELDATPGATVELMITAELIDGTPIAGSDCFTLVPAADLNADGKVNALDLLILINNWGDCDDATVQSCPADLNDDGVIDVLDLIILISHWE